MLLKKIKHDKDLSSFIIKECEENNVNVILDEKISDDRHIIIKVDKYYESLKMANTPSSPDCLILHKCFTSGYGITIIELKKTRRLSDLPTINIIIKKFKTCLNDFMAKKFKSYFNRKFERIELYYVISLNIHPNKLDGLNVETILEENIRFNGKRCIIRPPTTSGQIIKPCYKKNKT